MPYTRCTTPTDQDIEIDCGYEHSAPSPPFLAPSSNEQWGCSPSLSFTRLNDNWVPSQRKFDVSPAPSFYTPALDQHSAQSQSFLAPPPNQSWAPSPFPVLHSKPNVHCASQPLSLDALLALPPSPWLSGASPMEWHTPNEWHTEPEPPRSEWHTEPEPQWHTVPEPQWHTVPEPQWHTVPEPVHSEWHTEPEPPINEWHTEPEPRGDVEPADGQCGAPILRLPGELIAVVFSLLSIADRTAAAGTCRRLNTVERESRHYVEKLAIREQSIYAPAPCTWNETEQSIVFYEERAYSSECIRRVAMTARVGQLSIVLTGNSDFHREVYSLIKNFDVSALNLDFGNPKVERDLMTNETFFLDLAAACKCLMMTDRCESVPAKSLADLYKGLSFGARLRLLYMSIGRVSCLAFLDLIEIVYKEGNFYSNKQIEAYTLTRFYLLEDDIYMRKVTHLFDGAVEIVLYDEIFQEEQQKGKLEIKVHESLESLEVAKERDGLVAMLVLPESEIPYY